MNVTELLLSRHLSSFGKIGQRKILSLDQRSGSLNASRTPSRAKAGSEALVDLRAFTSTDWRVSRNAGKAGARRAIVIDQTSQQKETLRRIRDLQLVIKTLQSEVADKDDKIAALKQMCREGTKRHNARRRGHNMKRGRRGKSDVDPTSESPPSAFITAGRGDIYDEYDQSEHYHNGSHQAFSEWSPDEHGTHQWQSDERYPPGGRDQGQSLVKDAVQAQTHATSDEGQDGLSVSPDVASPGASQGEPRDPPGAPQDTDTQGEMSLSSTDAPSRSPCTLPHEALPGHTELSDTYEGTATGASNDAHPKAGCKGEFHSLSKGGYGKRKAFGGWRTGDDAASTKGKSKGYRLVSVSSDAFDEVDSEGSEDSRESKESEVEEEKDTDGTSKTRTDSDRLQRFYADDHSKTALDRITECLIRMYLRDGSLQKKVLRQELLAFTEKMILRWGVKKNFVPCGICPKTEARLTDVETRFASMQKDSLKEISMLRKNARLLESQIAVLKKAKGRAYNDETAKIEAETKARALEMKIECGNELYEPIMAFEKDQRDIMLEVINEKVRSILSMDAEAFGAKLPFGMKALPAEEAMAKAAMLEEELEKTSLELEKTKKKNWELMDERDKLKSENERLSTEGTLVGKRGAWADSVAVEAIKEGHKEELQRLKETHEEETEAMVERYEDLIAELKLELAGVKRKSVMEEAVVNQDDDAGHDVPAVQQLGTPTMSAEATERIAQLTKDLVSARRELAEYKEAQDHATRSAEAETEAQAQVNHAQCNQAPEVRTVTVVDNTKIALLEERITTMDTQRAMALQTVSELADVVGIVLSELGMNPSDEAVVFAGPDTAGVPGGVTTAQKDSGWEVLSQMLKQDVARLRGAQSRIVEMAQVETARIEMSKADITKSRKSGEVALDQIVQEKQKLSRVVEQQKEELERLQLVVDELRRRIQQMSEAAVDAGIPAEQLQEIMESSGLMGVAEVKDKKIALKVFQRLYDDAMDRLKRYSVMQAKIFAAQMGHTSPQVESLQHDRKFRGVEDYCDSVLQKWSVASFYKTLPPDYFMYGWIPKHGDDKPFPQCMKLEETRQPPENKGGLKLPPAETQGRRPLPAENRLLWRPRAQPRPCEKRPADWHASRTWTTFSAADIHFASEIVKRNKKHKSLKLF